MAAVLSGCGEAPAAYPSFNSSSSTSIGVTNPTSGSARTAPTRFLTFKGLNHSPTSSLSLRLFAANGQELTPNELETIHERQLHLIVIDKDARVFQHLHPTFSNGYWETDVAAPCSSTFYAYADFKPKNGPEEVLLTSLSTASSGVAACTARHQTVPEPGFSATLTTTTFVAGTDTELNFTVMKSGKPANIKPYLGAYGHVVIVQENNPERFLHVHPITTDSPKNGRVDFGTLFPAVGTYRVFAQFNSDGRIVTLPFTVNALGEAGNNTSPSEPAAHHDHH